MDTNVEERKTDIDTSAMKRFFTSNRSRMRINPMIKVDNVISEVMGSKCNPK